MILGFQRRAVPRPRYLSDLTKDVLSTIFWAAAMVGLIVLQIEYPNGIFG